MLTPGISTGYWKLRNSPSRLRSSADNSSRFLPLNVTSPSVTSKAGLPTNTLLNVLLPEPFGPMIACTSPGFTVRLMPFNISLPLILACKFLTSNITFYIIIIPHCPPTRWTATSVPPQRTPSGACSSPHGRSHSRSNQPPPPQRYLFAGNRRVAPH